MTLNYTQNLGNVLQWLILDKNITYFVEGIFAAPNSCNTLRWRGNDLCNISMNDKLVRVHRETIENHIIEIEETHYYRVGTVT